MECNICLCMTFFYSQDEQANAWSYEIIHDCFKEAGVLQSNGIRNLKFSRDSCFNQTNHL